MQALSVHTLSAVDGKISLSTVQNIFTNRFFELIMVRLVDDNSAGDILRDGITCSLVISKCNFLFGRASWNDTRVSDAEHYGVITSLMSVIANANKYFDLGTSM